MSQDDFRRFIDILSDVIGISESMTRDEIIEELEEEGFDVNSGVHEIIKYVRECSERAREKYGSD